MFATVTDGTANEANRTLGRGYLYAFLAAICGGAVPTLSKLVLPQTGPVAISGLAFLISGLMLFPAKARQVPNRRSIRWVLFFGLIGAAIAPVLYQTGLNTSTAVNASLLSNGEVLFTSLIAFSAFGERLGRSQLAMGFPIVAGIVIVSTNLDLSGVQFVQGLAGNLLILGSTFLWSIENNLIVSATQRFGAVLVTKYRNIIGGVLLLVVVVALGIQTSLNLLGIVYLLLLSLALAGVSFLAILSLGKIGALRAILVFSSTAIFGAVFALVVLREQITIVQVVGGALILGGVYGFQRSEGRPLPPAPRQEEFS